LFRYNSMLNIHSVKCNFHYLISENTAAAESKRFWTEQQKAFPKFNLFLIFSWIQVSFVSLTAKYLNVTFSKDSQKSLYWFYLAFWRKDINKYVSYFMSASTPTSLPASTRGSVFFSMVFMLSLKYYHHQQRPEPNVSNSIKILPCFLGPS
jgi:hypothetical protein